MPNPTPKGERVRTTLRLPVWIHESLRTEAFHKRRDINEIIVEELSGRYNDHNGASSFGREQEAAAHIEPAEQAA